MITINVVMKMKKEVLVVVMLMNLINYGSSQTVHIGTQVWMTKNLDVDTFRNGELIPHAKTMDEWNDSYENKKPCWRYWYDDPELNENHGKLYNWYAVNDSRGLAPTGYHIPTIEEWDELKDYLGSNPGEKLKSKSGWNTYTKKQSQLCQTCKDWNYEYRNKVPCHTCKDERFLYSSYTLSGNGTNNFGFSGEPSGALFDDGKWLLEGSHSLWWTPSENKSRVTDRSPSYGVHHIDYTNMHPDDLKRLMEAGYDIEYEAFIINLDYNSSGIHQISSNKKLGCSVRCLKDSDLVKHHFLKYLDEKSINYLLINSLPSLDDCKMVFKDTNADKYFEKIKEINEHWKENIELSESNEIYVDCQIESFTTSDLYLGDDLGGMERIKNKLQPNVTFYSVRYLREKDSQTGMVYKYFVNIKGDWIYFPKPYRILK